MMAIPEKRGDIIRAALELITEHGFHNTSMAMIADRAKVTAKTIYCYFESKDELAIEVFNHLENKMNTLILDGYTTGRPIKERFVFLGSSLLRYFIENPRDFKYLEWHYNSPYCMAYRWAEVLGKKGGRDRCRELFEEGISEKVIKDYPLSFLLTLAFGHLLEIARDHVFGLIKLDDYLIALFVEACWECFRGLRIERVTNNFEV
jgi:TetR/AcrR family transcriptional regulator, repressor of fatR-cypB operon